MVAHQTIETPANRLSDVYEAQRAAFEAEPVPSFGVRMNRLTRLQKALAGHEAEITAAIHGDFDNRAAHETQLADILSSQMAIGQAKRHLNAWMRPRRAATDPMFWPGRSRIVPQPRGVVGIIAPWNYPLLLSVGPLVGAIAAGNRAIVKPSEFTPKFSAVLARVIGEAFDASEVAVVLGGPDVGQALSALPLDHLMFTGSTRVGRLVAQEAAKTLTPVTLELGGKSPVILDTTADLDLAIRRVVRGKMFNAGQTCIAPDYMLVPQDKLDEVVERVLDTAKEMYPEVANNGELTAIIDARHHERLNGLVDDATAKGGVVRAHTAPSDIQRRMPLSVVTQVSDKMDVMQEEIFGPILPIVPYTDFEEALAYVRARPSPLALYWFGTHKGREGRVMSSAMAGGITINDTLMHVAQEALPFGGVGESGMGAYHGQYGFDALSHLKPVFVQSRWSGGDIFAPPLSGLARKMMGFASRWARR